MRTLNEDELLVYPNSCALCNEEERIHANRWHWLAGWHTWVAPNDTLRLMRMMKIREARLRMPIVTRSEHEYSCDVDGCHMIRTYPHHVTAQLQGWKVGTAELANGDSASFIACCAGHAGLVIGQQLEDLGK